VHHIEGERAMATIDGDAVKKLVVACDAGMGSSLMLAATLKKQLKHSGVSVSHCAVSEIPADADVVVTQNNLAIRVRASAPGIPVVPFQIFLGDPDVTRLVRAIVDKTSIEV